MNPERKKLSGKMAPDGRLKTVPSIRGGEVAEHINHGIAHMIAALTVTLGIGVGIVQVKESQEKAHGARESATFVAELDHAFHHDATTFERLAEEILNHQMPSVQREVLKKSCAAPRLYALAAQARAAADEECVDMDRRVSLHRRANRLHRLSFAVSRFVGEERAGW